MFQTQISHIVIKKMSQNFFEQFCICFNIIFTFNQSLNPMKWNLHNYLFLWSHNYWFVHPSILPNVICTIFSSLCVLLCNQSMSVQTTFNTISHFTQKSPIISTLWTFHYRSFNWFERSVCIAFLLGKKNLESLC
jgi:hypothetical protein